MNNEQVQQGEDVIPGRMYSEDEMIGFPEWIIYDRWVVLDYRDHNLSMLWFKRPNDAPLTTKQLLTEYLKTLTDETDHLLSTTKNRNRLEESIRQLKEEPIGVEEAAEKSKQLAIYLPLFTDDKKQNAEQYEKRMYFINGWDERAKWQAAQQGWTDERIIKLMEWVGGSGYSMRPFAEGDGTRFWYDPEYNKNSILTEELLEQYKSNLPVGTGYSEAEEKIKNLEWVISELHKEIYRLKKQEWSDEDMRLAALNGKGNFEGLPVWFDEGKFQAWLKKHNALKRAEQSKTDKKDN